MKSHLLLIIVFLCLAISTFAQKEQRELADTPNVVITFSPISLLSLMPALQIGVEYKLKAKRYMQHELAYMSGFIWQNFGEYNRLHGYRVRNELRFYKHMDKVNTNFFGGPGVSFRHRIGSGTEWFCMEGCSYQQLLKFSEHRLNVGAYGFLGFQSYTSKKFMVEWGVAIGAHTYYKKISGVPERASRRLGTELFDLDYNRWYVFPNGFFFLKLGWQVR